MEISNVKYLFPPRGPCSEVVVKRRKGLEDDFKGEFSRLSEDEEKAQTDEETPSNVETKETEVINSEEETTKVIILAFCISYFPFLAQNCRKEARDERSRRARG